MRSDPLLPSKHSAVLVFTFLAFHSLCAQRINGTLPAYAERPTQVILQEAWGGSHRDVDSTSVDRKGRFVFPHAMRGPGFYRLAIGNSELVDLIMDPREPEIILAFSGIPLQEHIAIKRSTQNQRLWEYKRASREGQAKLSALQEERKSIALTDAEASRALDVREDAVHQWQRAVLDGLIASDPKGPFERIILADRGMNAATGKGPGAMREAVDWQDQALVRSSVMPKALMGYLQELPETTIPVFSQACDSLLDWASPDPIAWSFSRSFLIRLFSIYGPDAVAQHLVDRYVSGTGSLVPPDAELLAATNALLRVAIGAKAPVVALVDPIAKDTIALNAMLEQNLYTLLFFYSSTCDHCHEQMPGLTELYTEQRERGFQVIGIALDADLDEFRTTLNERGLLWPSFSELTGWGALSAKAFAVKSTPSMFLLDRTATIVAKPYDQAEVRTTLLLMMP